MLQGEYSCLRNHCAIVYAVSVVHGTERIAPLPHHVGHHLLQAFVAPDPPPLSEPGSENPCNKPIIWAKTYFLSSFGSISHHHHSVGSDRLPLLLPSLRTEELSSDFRRDFRMKVALHHDAESLPRLVLHLVLVPLHKGEEGLMPQDRKFPFVVDEGGEVLHQASDDGGGEGVLFVQEGFDEYGRGAAVLELGEFVYGDGGVMDRYGDALKDRGHDGRLAEGAVVLAEGQEDALEECGGFVDRLFEGHVVVIIELLVGVDVGADGIEKDEVVEPLRHLRIEVGGEYARGGVHRLGRPQVRPCEVQDFLPVAQGGYDLEGLGQLPRGVSAQNFANVGVHLHHLGREIGQPPLLRPILHLPSLLRLLLLDFRHDDIGQRFPFLSASAHHRRHDFLLFGRQPRGSVDHRHVSGVVLDERLSAFAHVHHRSLVLLVFLVAAVRLIPPRSPQRPGSAVDAPPLPPPFLRLLLLGLGPLLATQFQYLPRRAFVEERLLLRVFVLIAVVLLFPSIVRIPPRSATDLRLGLGRRREFRSVLVLLDDLTEGGVTDGLADEGAGRDFLLFLRHDYFRVCAVRVLCAEGWMSGCKNGGGGRATRRP
mmetsp:Transcript_6588/g.13815  ORF Transcript_6588/g.13815 Transcript_6588/m.13815 type:complete len:595 (-) Transcript_6588:62-1846(-)